MADQIVPLDNSPNQTLRPTLSVDERNITLVLGIRYNEMAGYWVMTVSDTDEKVLIDSVPLITGEYPSANLLGQYAHLAIGSAYIVNVNNSPMDSPNATNLGSDFILVWSDTPKA